MIITGERLSRVAKQRQLWKIGAAVALVLALTGIATIFFTWKEQQRLATVELVRTLDADNSESLGRIHQLLVRGADWKSRGELSGLTVLAVACQHGDTPVVYESLQRGAAVNAHDTYGFAPLAQAATSGHAEIVRVLLGAGAEVNAASKAGLTALDLAAREGHTETVRPLLEGGACLNPPVNETNGGATPLMWAAAFADETTVALLLAKGADVRAKDKDGKTALAHATERVYWMQYYAPYRKGKERWDYLHGGREAQLRRTRAIVRLLKRY